MKRLRRLYSRSGHLDATAPFDFQKSLRFIDGFRPLKGEQDTSDGMLTKAAMMDGQTLVFRVGAERGNGGVYYELLSGTPLNDGLVHRASEQVSFFLSLQDDLRQFYDIASKDAKFFPTVKRLVGLHHVKFPSLFEVLCWAILAQRSQMAVAKKAKDALTERFGGRIEVDGTTYRAFPDYETLRAAKVKDILDATRNRRTTERLSSLMSSFGDIDRDFLLNAPYDKADERLKRIKGIGDWSAQFVLFRGLGRVERLRYNMGPVIRMMTDIYGAESKLEDINETYGRWSGYWSLYLWASTMSSLV